MQSLIGDRFLKRFFGDRSYRHKPNPAGEDESTLEYEAANPTELYCSPEEDLPNKEAALETNETGETN